MSRFLFFFLSLLFIYVLWVISFTLRKGAGFKFYSWQLLFRLPCYVSRSVLYYKPCMTQLAVVSFLFVLFVRMTGNLILERSAP
uniref:Putative secreted protein n=1 Tax=Ixodes ricinus TaxID=34613 RepID=A0A6B0TXQ6_IXORI